MSLDEATQNGLFNSDTNAPIPGIGRNALAKVLSTLDLKRGKKLSGTTCPRSR